MLYEVLNRHYSIFINLVIPIWWWQLVLERATRKLKNLTSLYPQNSNSAKLELKKKPEKLVLLKPKLEIFEQMSSLIHARSRQFETR